MPKFRMNMPASPTVHTKRYSSFKGVDFSSDPTQVDDSRSPRAVNVYPDATGCPQKRPGWAALLYSTLKGTDSIRGMYRFKTVENNDKDGNVKIPDMDKLIIHAGDSIYAISEMYDASTIPPQSELGSNNPYVSLETYSANETYSAKIMSGLTGVKSTGFMHNNRMYILTGAEYIVIKTVKLNGTWLLQAEHINASANNAYVPTTRLGCYYVKCSADVTREQIYDVQNGDPGEVNELANILNSRRKNGFEIPASDLPNQYLLLKLEGNVQAKLNSDGKMDYDAMLDNMMVIISTSTNVLRFKCSTKHTAGGLNYPLFEFTKHAGASAEYTNCLYVYGTNLHSYLKEKDDEITAGIISMTLEYSVEPPSGQTDLYTRISKCGMANWYNNRLFVTGNPDYPNADFYSQVGDPTYFPDINYTEIGSSDSRIMGYLTVGNQQAVLKSESIQLQDSSVYLRRAEWDSEEGYYYPLQSGIVGTGAVSEKAIMSFVDDPIFLTRDGVMAIVTENITGERLLAQRSSRINKRLLAEPNLENAVMHVWNGFLMIAVNGHLYLADSRQRTYARNSTNTYEYEWYYWERMCFVRRAEDRALVPDAITCFSEFNGKLYFGTQKGNVCVLKVGFDSVFDYVPYGISATNVTTRVVAEWATKLDDDGSFTLQKNLCRRGCGIFLKGVKNGKVKILVRTDKDYDDDMELVDKDLSSRSWNELNFEEFSFDNLSFKNKTCMVAAPNRRVKKYAALQIICSADTNSDFGLLGIEKRYTIGRYEK